MALDRGSVDEAVTLSPFRSPSMILVVPYVLETYGVEKTQDER